MRLLALFATVLALVFHNGSAQNRFTETKPKLIRVKSAAVIEGRCAVIVRPDDKKIKLLKKGISDDEYMTIVSDNQYYLGTAINFLDSVKIKQLEKLSNVVLSFKGSSGQYFKMPLYSLDWGIILFNGRDKPIIADVTDIDSSYRVYMKKQTSYKP